MATTSEAATTVAASFALVPPAIQELSQAASNVATVLGAILIPVIIWFNGRARDRTRATIELIRSLATDPGLYERASRVFRYRMFKEGAQGAVNPYATEGDHAAAHDCIVILNFFDVACMEIIKGTVDHNLLYETSRDPIVGAEMLFDQLKEIVKADRRGDFPSLVWTIDIWKQRARAQGRPIARPISAGSGPKTP